MRQSIHTPLDLPPLLAGLSYFTRKLDDDAPRSDPNRVHQSLDLLDRLAKASLDHRAPEILDPDPAGPPVGIPRRGAGLGIDLALLEMRQDRSRGLRRDVPCPLEEAERSRAHRTQEPIEVPGIEVFQERDKALLDAIEILPEGDDAGDGIETRGGRIDQGPPARPERVAERLRPRCATARADNVLLGPLLVDPLEDGPGGLPDLFRERVPREGLRR